MAAITNNPSTIVYPPDHRTLHHAKINKILLGVGLALAVTAIVASIALAIIGSYVLLPVGIIMAAKILVPLSFHVGTGLLIAYLFRTCCCRPRIVAPVKQTALYPNFISRSALQVQAQTVMDECNRQLEENMRYQVEEGRKRIEEQNRLLDERSKQRVAETNALMEQLTQDLKTEVKANEETL